MEEKKIRWFCLHCCRYFNFYLQKKKQYFVVCWTIYFHICEIDSVGLLFYNSTWQLLCKYNIFSSRVNIFPGIFFMNFVFLNQALLFEKKKKRKTNVLIMIGFEWFLFWLIIAIDNFFIVLRQVILQRYTLFPSRWKKGLYIFV